MMQGVRVKPASRDDLPILKAIIDACGLFPSEMLDEMIEPYLANQGEEFWLTASADYPLGLAYCAPERMTRGCWNLLLIAVHPNYQGRGYGAAIMNAAEGRLIEGNHRILLVETSGLPEFERTRTFYRKLGYGEEARIREFYDAGEDKIVFRKALRITS